ncbi:unnamed protein product [Brachionus calyciflorus]|uniref:Uncharacterized protein n=1 Tax=Brachionus calyciflorus TaxID=104777 RepID=A0A813MS53_9BILA|nr:unnamed protein product [Brachionus calyciflorus]
MSNQVWLVTIRFKKRGLMPNEFTVRLASTEFGDMYTVKELIDVGYKKLKENSLTGRNFFLTIPQRIVGYGRYIGYDSDSVLAVYTEKDKGRIALTDVARHVLVNNEVIVVEYYDRKLFFGTSFLVLTGLAYVGYNVRRYIRYRIHKDAMLALNKN